LGRTTTEHGNNVTELCIVKIKTRDFSHAGATGNLIRQYQDHCISIVSPYFVLASKLQRLDVLEQCLLRESKVNQCLFYLTRVSSGVARVIGSAHHVAVNSSLLCVALLAVSIRRYV